MCLAEVPFFYLSGALVGRMGVRGVIALAQLAYLTRFIFYSVRAAGALSINRRGVDCMSAMTCTRMRCVRDKLVHARSGTLCDENKTLVDGCICISLAPLITSQLMSTDGERSTSSGYLFALSCRHVLRPAVAHPVSPDAPSQSNDLSGFLFAPQCIGGKIPTCVEPR